MRKLFYLVLLLFVAGCGESLIFYQDPDNAYQVPTGIYEDSRLGVRLDIRNLPTDAPTATRTPVPASITPSPSPTTTLTPITPSATPQSPTEACTGVVVTTVNLNIRNQPGGTVIGKLSPGAVITILRFRVVNDTEWAEFGQGWVATGIGSAVYVEWIKDINTPEGLACWPPYTPHEGIDLPTAPPSRTPSITPTSTQSVSQTPSATVVFSTATPEGQLPSVTPGPTAFPKECTMRAITNVNIRSSPSESGARVGLWLERVSRVLTEFVVNEGYMWGKSDLGWSAVYEYATKDWLLEAFAEQGELCQDVPGWDQSLVPPVHVVRNPRGVHLIYSALPSAVSALLPTIGTIKATDGAEWALAAAKQYNPDITTVYRAIYTSWGKLDCPPTWGIGDPVAAADAWYDMLLGVWSSRGALQTADLIEYRNECLFVGAWEVAFDRRIIQRANGNGVCLLVFSDAPGNPELAEFIQRKPVLDLMLAQECRPGRYHAIAHHIYFGRDSGPWLFGRWQLFRAVLGSQYAGLEWWFTEYGVPNTEGKAEGRGPADCGAVISELAAVDMLFRTTKEVGGYHAYSVGQSTDWTDITPCIPL